MNPDQELAGKLAGILGISPVLAGILINRGITTAEEGKRFLQGTINDFHPPYMIGDLEKAVDIILENLEQENKILIQGDYDADGVTSTAILIKALERLEAQVGFHIPDRFDEGYGFSEEAIKKALDENYSLIITVDCGSSNWQEVEEARKRGLQVIVTDHHEVPEHIPDADAFINVKKPGDSYPFKDLSGAGIALKLVMALYSELGRDDWVDFIDLASIGTIADVVNLTGENRIIVKEGLKLLNKRERPGIAVLLELTAAKKEVLTPWDVSFLLAPKINAAGRLANADVALEFLLEEDPEKAAELAARLIKMNEERQQVELVIKERVENLINGNPDLLSQPVWVFGERGWHQGVIGIVASRFAEAFKRPVFLISIDNEGVGRGSARCSENYDIYSALDSSKHLLMHYGGHRLAGGFSLDEKNIDDFRISVSSSLHFNDNKRSVKVDAELPAWKINLALAKELETLAPFGEGNVKPLFLSRRIKFQSISTVGNNDQHLKVWVSSGTSSQPDLKGIAFSKGEMASKIFPNEFFYDILFNVDVDTWQAQEEVSLKISEILHPEDDCLHIQSRLEEITTQLKAKPKSGWYVVDARSVMDRRKYIRNLARSNKRCLVLTRNRKQMEVLMENLKKEGLGCGFITPEETFPYNIRIYIAPMDKIEKLTNFDEVIFYHPPFYLEHFRHPLYRLESVKRVHLLFGDEDVAREEANQEMLSPNRETLLKIFGYLKKNAPSGKISGFIPEQSVTVIKDPAIRAITIRIALKIFREIDLVDFTEENNRFEITIKSGNNKNLENSPIFRTHTRMRDEFGRIKQMLLSHNMDEFTESVNFTAKEPALS
ncbi:MAG: single-stranded-DNA-specific exonuclease RecJ [Firmicutes bacterium]|nr:single-stranded-DNA-specific exonuclease RecJ [Bacillota bacterium]